jgi:hypothetical protein
MKCVLPMAVSHQRLCLQQAPTLSMCMNTIWVPVSVPVDTLCIWHCFILETKAQLDLFKFPTPDCVGVRSSNAQ